MIRIREIDHVVLTVRLIDRTRTFYQRVLGMTSVEYAPGRWALHFGHQKLNLHEFDRPVDDKVRHATPGSADICFLTDTPLQQVAAHLAAQGVEIVAGPVQRTGARGMIMSIYLYDPDENLIEIANPL